MALELMGISRGRTHIVYWSSGRGRMESQAVKVIRRESVRSMSLHCRALIIVYY
jgi:hypothetical protein